MITRRLIDKNGDLNEEGKWLEDGIVKILEKFRYEYECQNYNQYDFLKVVKEALVKLEGNPFE